MLMQLTKTVATNTGNKTRNV